MIYLEKGHDPRRLPAAKGRQCPEISCAPIDSRETFDRGNTRKLYLAGTFYSTPSGLLGEARSLSMFDPSHIAHSKLDFDHRLLENPVQDHGGVVPVLNLDAIT